MQRAAALPPRKEPTNERNQKAKETEYRIFKEFSTQTDHDRIYLTAGHKIRVDIFEGYLWQVPELLRCKNWKICDSCDKGVCKTYYIDILPA